MRELGLKFITTIKRYDRVLMHIQAFKRKVRLHYSHNLESSDNSTLSTREEITELSGPRKPKLKSDPPKTDNQDLELFLDTIEKELLNLKKENGGCDNLKNTEGKHYIV